MHDRPPWSIEEDCELIDLDLCAYTLELHARVPAWRDYYLALDQRPHYAFLRRELQVLSYLRGPNRWVLKTPQHLEQLGPLLDTFPDATIAFTLRDPVAVLQSAITMLAYGDRHAPGPHRRRRAGRLLDRPDRTAAAGGRARRPSDPRAPAGRRRVRRVHGRRPRHGREDPRRRRARAHRRRARRVRDLPGRQPPGQGRPCGLRPAERLRCRSRRRCTSGSRSTTRRSPRSARRCADARHPPRAAGRGRHRRLDRRAGSRPRRRHLDVARALEQLPAPHRRGSGDRQHRHGLRGPAPPTGLRRASTTDRCARSSSPRATTTTSAASTCSATTARRSSRRRTSTRGGRTTSGSRRSGPATPRSRGWTRSSRPWSTARRSASARRPQARPEPTTTFDDRLELTHRRAAAGAALGAGRRDHRRARRLAARVAHRVHREHVRPAVRPRPEPRHDPRRPLPGRAGVRRVGRPGARACSPNA